MDEDVCNFTFYFRLILLYHHITIIHYNAIHLKAVIKSLSHVALLGSRVYRNMNFFYRYAGLWWTGDFELIDFLSFIYMKFFVLCQANVGSCCVMTGSFVHFYLLFLRGINFIFMSKDVHCSQQESLYIKRYDYVTLLS